MFVRQNARLSTSERISIPTRLSLYLRAHIPLQEALLLMESDAKRAPHTYALRQIKDQVSQGRTLAFACEKVPSLFEPFHISLIRIGESSGTLPESLQHLAHVLERHEKMRKALVSAAIYPAIIMTGTIGVSGFLAGYAFPKIVPLFKGIHTTLPLSTRILIWISDVVTRHGVVLLCVVGASIWLLMWTFRQTRVRHAIARLSVQLPYVSDMVRAYNLAVLSRSLSLLLRGGMPIVGALGVVADAVSQEMYKQTLHQVAQSVQGGRPMSYAMSTFPLLFPTLFVQLIATSERTGSLVTTLTYTTEMYEAELSERTAQITVLIEPLLMVLMGFLVGFVALAIISPMYGITQNLTPY